MRYIEVEQTGSPIRREGRQRQTLVGLGLNKIGRSKWVPDTPAVRGMIAKVSHLVRITHDPAAPKPPPARPVHDEATDIALARELVFDKNNIALESYDDAALKAGKTPDFKLIKDAKLCGFCEVKSPRDDVVLETPPPGGVAIRRNLPFYRKLGSHIKYAAEQFEAQNADHACPNILIFVSHTADVQRRDLIATIAGLPVSGGRPIFMLGKKMQKQVMDASRKIDLFLWIDATTGTLQHTSAADAKHRNAALELFGLSV